jgi:ABC-type lipoprotein export system ATPase subunit
MLELRDVRKTYPGPEGPVAAVDGISLTVSAGEFVVVRGPSGGGKTTLLLMAGGLLAPDAGYVLVDGQELYGLSPDARGLARARSIGFVFQQFHLVPYLTVLENVLSATIALKTPDAYARALVLIERVGLMHRLKHRPGALSTGERQRVAIARALMNGPSLILADEPTGNLDEANATEVLGYLSAFARGGGAVLLVTHDPRAAAYAGRTVCLAHGRILEAQEGDGDMVSSA